MNDEVRVPRDIAKQLKELSRENRELKVLNARLTRSIKLQRNAHTRELRWLKEIE